MLLFPSIAAGERLPLKAYTVAEGLANNSINRIVRDSRGFLWFCTNEGLSRFDGYAFRNYGTQQGLPHTVVNDLLETRAGEYWIATNGGLVRFDPKAPSDSRVVLAKDDDARNPHMFTVVITENEARRARVTVLLEGHDGTIWCGTDKGVYRLDRKGPGTLRPVSMGIPEQDPDQSYISDLVEDRNGSLWAATTHGLYRLKPDGQSTYYSTKDGLPDNYIHDLFLDHAGRLWVGTRYSGLFMLSDTDGHGPLRITFQLNRANGLPTGWIFQLFETSDHRFWAATARGLVQFFPDGNASGQQYRVYSEKNGLTYHDISALGEDVAGNLWLGTDSTGAMKLARNGFITYDTQDGIMATNAIFSDQKNEVCFRGFVVGDKNASIFDGGKIDSMSLDQATDWPRLGRYDGKQFTWFAPDAFQNDSWGWVSEGVTLQTRSGEWWIGAHEGLYHFRSSPDLMQIKHARPLEVLQEKEQLPEGRVFRLFEDSRERIWISTIQNGANSLSIWTRDSGIARNLDGSEHLPSFKEDLVHSFGEDGEGDVWLGFGGGVARYRGNGFTFFSSADGLPPGAIQSIYFDRAGRLWLGSARSGLIRVDNPSSDAPKFSSYSTAQHLSSDNAEVITEDLEGHIFVGTARGLDRLDPATGGIEHFTTADGLAAGDFLSAFRDRDGALWFGTQKGLSRFMPRSNRQDPPPPILIEGLKIAGAPQAVSALGESQISLPALSASENQLQIDFLSLDFTPGEVLTYQYKLEGAGSDWGAPTEERTVNYARLSPGNYRFLVRAVNSDGIASSSPAVVSFAILPPIWQRWWFVLLAVLTIALMTYAFFRYRVSRILEVANIRTGIAADLHDDIGSNLTRIAILSEVAHSRLQGANAAVDNPLKSIAEISRESVASMGDIVWAINPKRDTLLDLIQRMRRLATEMLTSRGIAFEFRAPESHPDLKLGANVRRDLFLVFKEVLHNVVRHSKAQQVEIDLQVERASIILRMCDDGRGFDADKMSDGHGLISMKRRAENLGGKLTIDSRSGAGTELVLRFPRRGR